MIDLALLGTGALMPMPDRWLSSLLVRSNGELTLFDCGEGTQVAWRAVGWNPRRVGAICLSHLHADHVAGLPGMLYLFAHAGREEAVTIHGPVGTVRVVSGLRSIAPDLPFPVVVTEHDPGAGFLLPGGLTARTGAGSHGVPCLAYRIRLSRAPRFLTDRARQLGAPVELWSRLQAGEEVTWNGSTVTPAQVMGAARPGVSFAYVTDTRRTRGLTVLVDQVDLLVCEGTYGESSDQERANRRGHMTFADAATLASSARVGQLWLTHFSTAMSDPESYLENATAIFLKTEIGKDGMTKHLVFQQVKS